MESISEAIRNIINRRILPWIERDGAAGLILPEQITAADCARPPRCEHPCERRHHEPELAVGLAGEAMYCIEGKRFIFTPSRIMLLPAGTSHVPIESKRCRTRDLDLEQSSSILWFHAYPFGVIVQGTRSVGGADTGEITWPYMFIGRYFGRLLTELLEEVRLRPPNYARVGRSILMEFMERCIQAAAEAEPLQVRSAGDNGPARSRKRRPAANALREPVGEASAAAVTSRVRAAQEFIRYNYHTPIGLDDIAEAADTSVSHLGRQFRAVTDLSPMQYLLNVRMEAAKELLLTDLNIARVAGLVGIEDACYFSRVFRRISGVSPRRYRKDLARLGDSRRAESAKHTATSAKPRKAE